MAALDRLPVMRRKKMGEKTLAVIDDCIKRGKTPMQSNVSARTNNCWEQIPGLLLDQAL